MSPQVYLNYTLPVPSLGTRGLQAGGRQSSYGDTNVIDYFDIATVGNATDFGDSTVTANEQRGFSESHGGLAG